MIRRQEDALAQARKTPRHDPRHEAIISSALWAAAGDAIGWITELGDENTIRHRTGHTRVDSPVDWRRRIGGRFGPTLQLPSGTYSDDTQLRLAVSRATRGNGDFDVEAFAKVELPVWSSYSLGAGRGTTAAASNLAKGTVSWFSNFFGGRGERGYVDAGGNGAAMRIQPHVWKCAPDEHATFVRDVLRDAVTTHGHPKGFCGALFHAFCLAHALSVHQIPKPDDWISFADQLRCVPEAIAADEQLSLFWLGPWEDSFGKTIKKAIEAEIDSLIKMIKSFDISNVSREAAYAGILTKTGAFSEDTRGAGLNTALAAAALSYLSTDTENSSAMRLAANTPGSDTDTIATMAGAILGAVRPEPVDWDLQDRDYITDEAVRISEISLGKTTDTFHYPNLISWSPPTTQLDAIGIFEDRMWLVGLGRVEPFGELLSVADVEWQWSKLDFGQTILAKRRAKPRRLSQKDIPNEHEGIGMTYFQPFQRPLFRDDAAPKITKSKQQKASKKAERTEQAEEDIDLLTAQIIERGFLPQEIGDAILKLAQGSKAIERSIAFSAIIAKALEARRKRQRR
jgi:ADP-ribosylglycohydrolase